MKLIVLALALCNAAAFTPARAPRRAATSMSLNGWVPDSSAFCYGLPGAIPPVGNFDPAGFSTGKTVGQVKMLREAEVTHGRVSMLAVLGFLVQEEFHFLFVEPDKEIGPAIRHLDEVRAVNPWFFEVLTFSIALAEAFRSVIGWTNPAGATGGPVGGLPDGEVRALLDDYYPGDVGFDPLGLKPSDPAEFAEMATKEFQNGRLAMLAAAGFFAQELVNGKTIVETFSDLWPDAPR